MSPRRKPNAILRRTLRQKRKFWTVEDLAKRVGKSVSWIYRVLDGNILPSPALAVSLARELDVDVEGIKTTTRGRGRPRKAA